MFNLEFYTPSGIDSEINKFFEDCRKNLSSFEILSTNTAVAGLSYCVTIIYSFLNKN